LLNSLWRIKALERKDDTEMGAQCCKGSAADDAMWGARKDMDVHEMKREPS